MNCQETIDLMEEAVDGRLPPVSRAGFEEHIAACASCGTYLEQLRLTRRALRSLPRRGGTSPRRAELIEEFKKTFPEQDE